MATTRSPTGVSQATADTSRPKPTRDPKLGMFTEEKKAALKAGGANSRQEADGRASAYSGSDFGDGDIRSRVDGVYFICLIGLSGHSCWKCHRQQYCQHAADPGLGRDHRAGAASERALFFHKTWYNKNENPFGVWKPLVME